MRLHVHEWGDRGSPTLVCLHGVTTHGRRFRKLAEERWADRFHVLAPDLRGHGESGYEPPWDIETHVADLIETVGEAGTWVGHSFGGRLVLEVAKRQPELVARAVLLDPAIQILPHVGFDFAEEARQRSRHGLQRAVHRAAAARSPSRADTASVRGPVRPRPP